MTTAVKKWIERADYDEENVHMVTKKNLKNKIIRFIAILKEDISVNRVILFGSFAKGNPRPYSDVDIAVFSPDFKEKDEIKNMQYLFKKAVLVDSAIEPHPYHPRELKRAERGSLLYEIMKTGKRVG